MFVVGPDGSIANLEEIMLVPERAAIKVASIVAIIVASTAAAAKEEEEEEVWAGALGGAAGSECSMIVEVAVDSGCVTFLA